MAKQVITTATSSACEPDRRQDQQLDVVRITTRLNVGGIARHVSWLSAGLTDFGYSTLLVAGTIPPGEDDMSSFSRSLGVEPHYFKEMSREISLRDLVTIWKLYRLFLRVKPNLVHTHAAKAGFVGRVACALYRWLTPGVLVGRPRKCKVVHTFHGHVFHSYYGALKTWLFLLVERCLARLATDRIIVISPQQHKEIHERFRVGNPTQFRIIPLGLDLSAYSRWQESRSYLRAELRVGEETLLVGIVGRLTEIKNHRLFLQIAAETAKDPSLASRIRFVVIGDGHLRKELTSYCRELHLEDRVLFLGNRTDPEIFYPGLDIVALTSLNEGTPLTLIEAMANARPVISTDVGGVVDLLGESSSEIASGFEVRQRGLSVKSGDVRGFTHGLALLVRNGELRRQLGLDGLDFVTRCYDKQRLLLDVAQLYGELLGKEAIPEVADSPPGGEVCVS